MNILILFIIIVALLFFLGSNIFSFFLGTLKDGLKKALGVPFHDMSSGKWYFIDPTSIKQASTEGMVLVKKLGAFGFFNKTLTVPKPFVMRNIRAGKIVLYASPWNDFVRDVNGVLSLSLEEYDRALLDRDDLRVELDNYKQVTEENILTRANKVVKLSLENQPWYNNSKKKSSSYGGGKSGY